MILDDESNQQQRYVGIKQIHVSRLNVPKIVKNVNTMIQKLNILDTFSFGQNTNLKLNQNFEQQIHQRDLLKSYRISKYQKIKYNQAFQQFEMIFINDTEQIIFQNLYIQIYNISESQCEYSRFNKTNLIFGGKWKRQEFTKILILESHYALTYTFTVREYNFINPKDLIQIDGDANKPDSIVQYCKYFKNTNNDIIIAIGCNTNGYCFLMIIIQLSINAHHIANYVMDQQNLNVWSSPDILMNLIIKLNYLNLAIFESDDNMCQK
ncbi:unnamed protein product [Paramecium sonneborni]|uniref:Uncharacterized protein n=1 Tax=Paramecium sonneborni TaxID=65129 RepID=A0A8S1LVB0_9CILI|nr:unnamed protein product [Paramecium sonneborni]